MVKDKDYEKSSGNVFEDLEFENSKQELLKAELAHCIHKAKLEKNLTQSQAIIAMGVSQCGISSNREENTIPKTYLLVRHQVTDFPHWKSVYDKDRSGRENAGLKELYLLHDIQDPDKLTLLFEIEDMEKAKAFLTSPEAEDKKKEAEVISVPEICFLYSRV